MSLRSVYQRHLQTLSERKECTVSVQPRVKILREARPSLKLSKCGRTHKQKEVTTLIIKFENRIVSVELWRVQKSA